MEHAKETGGAKETLRIEAFSDGVFAIAITLLILEVIEISHPVKGQSLVSSCLSHWKSFLAFSIGFCTILVCWINHHHLFTYIHKSDSNLVWVNGALLFVVTLTPFPTAILADYMGKENNAAIAMFGFTYFLMSCVYAWVAAYALNHNLIDDSKDKGFFRYIKLTYYYCIVYTFIAFFVCFLSVPVAVTMYVLMFGVFAFPKEFAARLNKMKNKDSVPA